MFGYFSVFFFFKSVEWFQVILVWWGLMSTKMSKEKHVFFMLLIRSTVEKTHVNWLSNQTWLLFMVGNHLFNSTLITTELLNNLTKRGVLTYVNPVVQSLLAFLARTPVLQALQVLDVQVWTGRIKECSSSENLTWR